MRSHAEHGNEAKSGVMQHTTGRNLRVAFSGRGQENAFRQAVSAGIMACVVGAARKTRCCTGKGELAT